MLQIFEALKDVERYGPILHILANQVADILARRRVHIFVARSLIHILAQRVGQLNIETAAQNSSRCRILDSFIVT